VVRIRACTEGQGSVGITMLVSVNSATDGSSNGTWQILTELGVPCFNEHDAPTWNTLEYASGSHRIRVEAHGWHETWNGAAVREMTYNVRSDHRPNHPNTRSPVYDSWLDSQTVRFRWDTTWRTSSYRLQASLDPNFGDLLIDKSFGSSVSEYTHTFSSSYAMLYWRVIAIGPHGQNLASSRFRMDTNPPSSTMTPLPETVPDAAFPASWSGSDDRSGIRWYHVQVRDVTRTEGSWEDWLEKTPKTSETFVGRLGHTYIFRVRAMDTAGNWEAWPTGEHGSARTTADASDSTAGTPELAVVGLSTHIQQEGGALIEVTIENQGDGSTANDFFTDLYLDHLPAGPGDFAGSITFWINEPLASGERALLVTRVEDPALALQATSSVMSEPMQEITRTLYAQVDSAGSVTGSVSGNKISDPVELCFAQADQYEFGGDGPSSAAFLGMNEQQQRNFHEPSDQDWFRFQAWENTTYVIHTYNLA